MSAMFTPHFNAFRFYDDDGDSDNSTPLEAQDVNHSLTVDADQSIQLRGRIDETGGTDGTTMDDYSVRYNKNSAGFVDLPQTDQGDGIFATTAGLTNETATTNRATDGISDPGGGSFVAGEESSDAEVTDMQLTASNFTEHAWGIGFAEANLADADSFVFELNKPSAIVNNVTPTITIVKTGGPVEASGGATLAAAVAAGTATVRKSASGGATLAPAVAAGTAKKRVPASGGATVAAVIAAGTAKKVHRPSGGATLAPATASGTSKKHVNANGGATLAPATAAGTASLPGGNPTASGAATLAAATAAGTATVRKSASGAATLAAAIAAGTAKKRLQASGAASLLPATATGAAKLVHKASGAASLLALVATGSARVVRKASGAATLAVVTGAGVASIFVGTIIVRKITLEGRIIDITLDGRDVQQITLPGFLEQ